MVPGHHILERREYPEEPVPDRTGPELRRDGRRTGRDERETVLFAPLQRSTLALGSMLGAGIHTLTAFDLSFLLFFFSVVVARGLEYGYHGLLLGKRIVSIRWLHGLPPASGNGRRVFGLVYFPWEPSRMFVWRRGGHGRTCWWAYIC